MRYIPWDKISLDEWRLTYPEDDQFQKFPYLKLVQKPDRTNGVHLVDPFDFKALNNIMRGILTSKRSGFLDDKLVALMALLKLGWLSTSWAIPYVNYEGRKINFDRRHTLKDLLELITVHRYDIPCVYGAEYERVWTNDPNDIVNSFTTETILLIAGMWGNVCSPVPADTKDHNFISLTRYIIHTEEKILGKGTLTNDQTIKDILKSMGVYVRYNWNESFIKSMVTRVKQDVEDTNGVGHLQAINNQGLKEQVVKFMHESDEWGRDNTEDDESFFSMRTYNKATNITNATAEEILAAAVRKENQNLEKGSNKTLKIMMFNEKDSENSIGIATARKNLMTTLKDRWELKRDSAYRPVYEKLKPGVFEEKVISDLNFEIWFYPQIQGETEPFLQPFI